MSKCECKKCNSILTDKEIDKYMLKYNDMEDYIEFNDASIYDEFVYYCPICETEVMIHIANNEIHYILFDKDNSEDCKEYIMTYEIDEYVWKVYVDDIEGWQKCKVIDINNTLLGINRATVICESGTQLNRRVKFVLDEEDEDFKTDGCIYYYENLED